MREGHAVACRLRIATLAVPAVLLTLAQTLWAGSAPAAAKPASGSIIGRLLPVDAEAEVAVQDVSRNGLFVARISVTSLDGSYRIDGIPPGEYGVTFTAPGYQPDGPTVRLRPGETLDLGTVTLKPIPPSPLAKGAAPARIVGRLLPAAEARIHVVHAKTMDDDEIREVIAKARPADEGGAFRIEGIASGNYDVEMRAPGCVPQVQSITIVSGQTLDLGTVTLVPAGAIAGRIRPFPVDAVVLARKREAMPTGAVVGMAFPVDPQTGRYVIEGLLEGLYDLTIEADGYRTVKGIENFNLVTQPEPLSPSDHAGIEAAFAALDRARRERDYLAELALYSKHFGDPSGRTYEQVRKDFLRLAVQRKEEIKRGPAERAAPRASKTGWTIERILYGHGEATVICRITELWPDPKKGGTRRIESPRVWGLRKENGAWRFTFRSLAGGEPLEALTWDPRVSGIRVVPGQVSRGRDWTLVPLPPARTGE